MATTSTLTQIFANADASEAFALLTTSGMTKFANVSVLMPEPVPLTLFSTLQHAHAFVQFLKALAEQVNYSAGMLARASALMTVHVQQMNTEISPLAYANALQTMKMVSMLLTQIPSGTPMNALGNVLHMNVTSMATTLTPRSASADASTKAAQPTTRSKLPRVLAFVTFQTTLKTHALLMSLGMRTVAAAVPALNLPADQVNTGTQHSVNANAFQLAAIGTPKNKLQMDVDVKPAQSHPEYFLSMFCRFNLKLKKKTRS